MLARLKQIMAQPNIAVDLGTANTRVCAPDRAVLSEEPSQLSQITRGDVQQIKDEYIAYLNSKLFFAPLRGGVIVDVDKAAQLLRPMVRKSKKSLRPPVILACAPTDTSEKERALLAKAVLDAGARRVAIIPEVWAAALGAGLDVDRPSAQALIDMGHGVTDLAVIAGGRLIAAMAVRTACGELQKAVRSAVIERHKVYLYARDVEMLTNHVAALAERQRPAPSKSCFSGMDIIKRRKATIELDDGDVVRALEPVVERIIGMILRGLRQLPTEIQGQIARAGISLTGGGACVKGMDTLIARHANLEVRVAPDPIHSVINGASQALESWKERDGWWEQIAWPRLSPWLGQA